MEAWIIAGIGWVLMIVLWVKGKKKDESQKAIKNQVNLIIKSDRFKDTPEEVKSHFKIIANASGISITDF